MTTRRIRRGCLRVLTATALVAAVVSTGAVSAHADPDVSDIEAQIEEQAIDLEAVIEDYNAVSEELDDTKDQIAELEEKLAPYQEQLDELYDETEPIITAAYQNHNMDTALVMLNSGSPEAFAQRVTALNGATASDAALIAEVSEAKAGYDEDLAALEDLRTQQSDQETEMADKKDIIESEMAQLQEDRKNLIKEDAESRGETIEYVPDYIPGIRGEVVRHAMAQLGKPYVWAAAGPDGYDCSGLVLDAWAQVGIGLPHNAAQQYNVGTRIGRDQLQPGDAVYYNGLQHVALYIGDGYVVHAPNFGDVVKVATIDGAATPYYGATTFI